MYLFRSVTYLMLLFYTAFLAYGELVSVDGVKFKSVKDDWLMCEIKISTGKNIMPEAPSEDFIENVKVRLYLGFKNNSFLDGIDYYYSEVTIIVLERGDKNFVRFYIPGKKLDMYRYNKPQYFYAEIVCDKMVFSPKSRSFSTSFKNIESLNNFVKKAKAGSFTNFGQLVPSYLTPLAISGADLDAPVYLRTRN